MVQSASPTRRDCWHHIAAMPATCGVAMLVPLKTACVPRPTGTLENTATPGAAISTLPPAPVTGLLRGEKFAMRKLLSRAATAMIDGLLAGWPTNPRLPPVRFALLRMPRR